LLAPLDQSRCKRVVVYLLIAVFVSLGAWATIGNYAAIMQRKGGSLSPLLGGLLLAAAMFLYPAARVRHYAWIPLVLDPGCLVMFACALFSKLRPKVRQS
jgi:hypothetical protein